MRHIQGQAIAIYKTVNYGCYILMLFFVMTIFFSCSTKSVISNISYVVIEYEREVYKGYEYIPVKLNEPHDINVVENVIATKEIVPASFPRKQYLTIVYVNGEKVEYDVNDFVLRDTEHCYIIPAGKLREKFQSLINSKEPPQDNSVSPIDKLSVRNVKNAPF